jgi:hypothetical protein
VMQTTLRPSFTKQLLKKSLINFFPTNSWNILLLLSATEFHLGKTS